jgi:hypothetical protein
MDIVFLTLLFILTVGHIVTLKQCAGDLDHRTAPLFISGWTLLGLLAVSPFYGHLFLEGLVIFAEHPYMLLLAAGKGAVLYVLFIVSQRLMKDSLSSRHYVTPMTIGLMAVVNFALGEHLNWAQWASAAGLFALSTLFFFTGHLSSLSRGSRIAYFQLVGLSVMLSAVDQVLTSKANWYILLVVSYTVLFGCAITINRKRLDVLKPALLHKSAIFAGAVYAVTELVKFYQMGTINPVTVVAMTQAMTKPVILVISALVWKERTVREQLAWGTLAFFLVLLPHFVKLYTG